MTQSWKITVLADQDTIEAALLAHEDATEWDPSIVLAACEIADHRPEEWKLEAFLPRKPAKKDLAAVAALFPGAAPRMATEALPETDWIMESQQGLAPIRAGRFHVRTPDFPACGEAGVFDFAIPASQAFGTGHHETTAGCLSMLTRMKRHGLIARNAADIGTGTGILAFAALKLWPRAIVTASDIDPLSAAVTLENAALNGIGIGAGSGEMTVTIAAGMASPLIAARGPYDLVIANILAGPLIELAADFSRALVPGGNLLLAGLLDTQEEKVRRACRRAGLRLAAREGRGDWSILWLRKRSGASVRGGRGIAWR